MKTAVILLAGGLGTRMCSDLPKQFLELRGKPIALYSFEVFQQIPAVQEIVVVADPLYRDLFRSTSIPLNFALPGPSRQESMFNGWQAIESSPDLICIHDSARPFITPEQVNQVLQSAQEHGAASLAMPIMFTVKQTTPNAFVDRTLNRDLLWEVQTPQVIKRELLEKAFQQARETHVTVTDDVSLVERIGAPVKLVEGSSMNLKITTPDDLILADFFWERNRANVQASFSL